MEKKKHNIKNLLIWGILGLFVVSGMMQGNVFGIRNPVVARVGSLQIKVSDIRKYANLIQLPEGIDREDTRVQEYVFRQARDLLINRALITQECKRLGFVVSDAKVVEVIKKQRQFISEGKFSRAKFLEELSKMGLSEMEYKSIQKENLLHRQWTFMLQNAYIVPNSAAKVIASTYSQKRSGRYAVIDRSKMSVPKLNPADLEKFYKDNIELFKVPQKRVYKILAFKDNKNAQKLQSMLDNQKFGDVQKKFEHVAIMSDADVESLNALVPSELIKFFDRMPLKTGENTRLYGVGEKRYAAQLVRVEDAYTPELSKIKDKVVAEYAKQYRLKNVQPGSGWFKLFDVKFGENYLGLPDVVLQALFFNPVGKIARYDKENETYFVVVDKIAQGEASPAQVQASANYLQQAMLNDVVYAALNSLRLRYKITVLI